MTVKEALDKVREYFNEEVVLVDGREYDDFYGLFVAPPGSPTDEAVFVGSMICVDKEDGKVFSFDDLEIDNPERLEWFPIDM